MEYQLVQCDGQKYIMPRIMIIFSSDPVVETAGGNFFLVRLILSLSTVVIGYTFLCSALVVREQRARYPGLIR